MMAFEINYLKIFSTNSNYEGGITIDGLRFNEETLHNKNFRMASATTYR